MATSSELTLHPPLPANACDGASIWAASTSSGVISRMRPALGSYVAIEAQAPDARAAERGVAHAYRAVQQVERLMHPTRCGSDLALLREARAGVPVRLHPWTFATLALCRQLNRRSRGIFDPCPPDSPGRFAELQLRHPAVAIARTPLRLDLGGIAKGFAVDRALDALRLAGCTAGLVNAGGDLAVFGERCRELWCRRSDGRGAVVSLRNAALATSDADNALRPAEHRGYYRSAAARGHGARGLDTLEAAVTGWVAVTAPSAAVADGLTKCVLIGERAAMMPVLESFAARLIEVEESI